MQWQIKQGPIFMITGTRENPLPPPPPPSYPWRANYSLISFKNSADRLHEVMNSSRAGETT